MKLKVPATTANLGPGFDCLGVALSLYNEFEVDIAPKGLTKDLNINVIGEGFDIIPKDKTSMIYQAIKKVCQRCNHPVPKLDIKIKSNIPVCRGLGSSATVILAGVVLGNKICGERLSTKELLNIAVEIEGHPDNIVPAMFGGLCCSTIIGREVKFVKLTLPEDLVCLVIIPEIKVPTEKARKVLPKKVNFSDATKNLSNVALLISSLIARKYEMLNFAMKDWLHQPYRARLIPWMKKIFDLCLSNSALGVALSGSGSSIIAIYKKGILTEKIAQKVCALGQRYVDAKLNYKILNFVSTGVKVG